MVKFEVGTYYLLSDKFLTRILQEVKNFKYTFKVYSGRKKLSNSQQVNTQIQYLIIHVFKPLSRLHSIGFFNYKNDFFF